MTSSEISASKLIITDALPYEHNTQSSDNNQTTSISSQYKTNDELKLSDIEIEQDAQLALNIKSLPQAKIPATKNWEGLWQVLVDDDEWDPKINPDVYVDKSYLKEFESGEVPYHRIRLKELENGILPRIDGEISLPATAIENFLLYGRSGLVGRLKSYQLCQTIEADNVNKRAIQIEIIKASAIHYVCFVSVMEYIPRADGTLIFRYKTLALDELPENTQAERERKTHYMSAFSQAKDNLPWASIIVEPDSIEGAYVGTIKEPETNTYHITYGAKALFNPKNGLVKEVSSWKDVIISGITSGFEKSLAIAKEQYTLSQSL